MTVFETYLILITGTLLTINFFILFRILNNTAVCPITKKKDFKSNMYIYHFAPVGMDGGGHSTYYSKKGFEKRFDCKIIKQEINKRGWKSIPNKKRRK